ncbi:MAG: hypothetical protein GWP08_19125 [Nitrospiraceae bacterium]|nr:hypothetical protein [Nitrospiraceae bacterium]
MRVQDGVLAREDYCDACWNADRTGNAFSVWNSRFYDPQVAEQEPPESFSPLRQVFYESVESDSREETATAYLAAQLLRRQKVFRLIKQGDDPDGEVHLILYSDRLANRLIEVRDPNLSYAEMEEGRTRLLARLAEFEQPEDAEEETPDAQAQQA